MFLVKRKLQKISGTLYVSLPQAWVKEFAFEKGMEIGMSVNKKGELFLKPNEDLK
jgi:phosphate uptake regulator